MSPALHSDPTPIAPQKISAKKAPFSLSVALKYIGDWILVFCSFSIGLYLESVSPYERYIIPDDTISYPFVAHEKIPPIWLPFVGILVPSIIICIIAFFLYLSTILNYSELKYADPFFSKYHWSQFIHLNMLGLDLSVSGCYLITNILKLSCGRLRPDFIARCKPKSLTSFPIVCMGDARHVAEGRKSFPSGHTSIAFSGLGYVFFLLVSLFWSVSHSSCQHYNHGMTMKLILTLLPLMVATIIGITRLEDYRHHWQDVAVGAVLGMLLAYISFRQFHTNPFRRPKCQPNKQVELKPIDSEDVLTSV